MGYRLIENLNANECASAMEVPDAARQQRGEALALGVQGDAQGAFLQEGLCALRYGGCANVWKDPREDQQV